MSFPMTDWIDISVPVRPGMVHWPGDPEFRIERRLDMDKGDPCTVSRISMGVHTGTHMDAPLHFLRSGASIDSMPISATVGPARVIPITNTESVKPAELEQHLIQAGERILLKTANSDHAWNTDDFIENFVYISREGANYLAECNVAAVGVDYLSVGGFTKDGPETHEALLSAGVWVIEGLNLSGIEPGDYDLVCLPLLLIGAEGAPARAILNRRPE